MTVLPEYAIALIFLLAGAAFAAGMLGLARLLSPSKPNPEKNATYECGEATEGAAWQQFNPRFYVIALAFLVFEVELVFLFPWATIFADDALNATTQGRWGWLALTEIVLFVFILALGLAYLWKNGLLEWDKPPVRTTAQSFEPTLPTKIDRSVYDAFNAAQAHRPHPAENSSPTA
jgi:NADH-quinone oxidoreductase subunit A